ncbi:MAG: hypothetical protein QW338_03360 [Conexivisphaerales archaeon]
MADTVRRLVFAAIGFIIVFIGLFFAFSPNINAPVLVSAVLVVAGGIIGFIGIINLRRLTPQQPHKTKKAPVIVVLALVAIIGGSWLLAMINSAWSLEPVFVRFFMQFPIHYFSPDIPPSLTGYITVIMVLFMLVSITIIGWVANGRDADSPTTPISKELPNSKYIKCPVCGNEEFIEYENYQEMIPYINFGQKSAILAGIYSYVCANCKAVLESGQFTPTQPVAGVKYISCANCGSTEYLETIVTRVKITNAPDLKNEDLNKSVSTIVCFKCGQPFVDPDEEPQKTKIYSEFSAASG